MITYTRKPLQVEDNNFTEIISQLLIAFKEEQIKEKPETNICINFNTDPSELQSFIYTCNDFIKRYNEQYKNDNFFILFKKIPTENCSLILSCQNPKDQNVKFFEFVNSILNNYKLAFSPSSKEENSTNNQNLCENYASNKFKNKGCSKQNHTPKLKLEVNLANITDALKSSMAIFKELKENKSLPSLDSYFFSDEYTYEFDDNALEYQILTKYTVFVLKKINSNYIFRWKNTTHQHSASEKTLRLICDIKEKPDLSVFELAYEIFANFLKKIVEIVDFYALQIRDIEGNPEHTQNDINEAVDTFKKEITFIIFTELGQDLANIYIYERYFPEIYQELNNKLLQKSLQDDPFDQPSSTINENFLSDNVSVNVKKQKETQKEEIKNIFKEKKHSSTTPKFNSKKLKAVCEQIKTLLDQLTHIKNQQIEAGTIGVEFLDLCKQNSFEFLFLKHYLPFVLRKINTKLECSVSDAMILEEDKPKKDSKSINDNDSKSNSDKNSEIKNNTNPNKTSKPKNQENGKINEIIKVDFTWDPNIKADFIRAYFLKAKLKFEKIYKELGILRTARFKYDKNKTKSNLENPYPLITKLYMCNKLQNDNMHFNLYYEFLLDACIEFPKQRQAYHTLKTFKKMLHNLITTFNNCKELGKCENILLFYDIPSLPKNSFCYKFIKFYPKAILNKIFKNNPTIMHCIDEIVPEGTLFDSQQKLLNDNKTNSVDSKTGSFIFIKNPTNSKVFEQMIQSLGEILNILVETKDCKLKSDEIFTSTKNKIEQKILQLNDNELTKIFDLKKEIEKENPFKNNL